ncbi:MAG: hypothetical protein H0U85_03370 [Gemmatimonadales bacterium]|nr:hypothetical protein [Gemmatimonadales bacterium]
MTGRGRPRTRFIDHVGRKILLIDFSGIEDAQTALDAISEARAVVAAQPADGSLLTLTSVDGAYFDSGVLKAIRELAEHNRPYVRAGAVVGLTGLMKVVYNTLVHLTGRNIKPFESLEAAKTFLVAQ